MSFIFIRELGIFKDAVAHHLPFKDFFGIGAARVLDPEAQALQMVQEQKGKGQVAQFLGNVGESRLRLTVGMVEREDEERFVRAAQRMVMFNDPGDEKVFDAKRKFRIINFRPRCILKDRLEADAELSYGVFLVLLGRAANGADGVDIADSPFGEIFIFGRGIGDAEMPLGVVEEKQPVLLQFKTRFACAGVIGVLQEFINEVRLFPVFSHSAGLHSMKGNIVLESFRGIRSFDGKARKIFPLFLFHGASPGSLALGG